jgi:salicylate biosynthesis isochorismate synthase
MRRGGPVLVAWTRQLPGVGPRALLRRAEQVSGRVFFWMSRWTGVESLAVGSSSDLSAEGTDRTPERRPGLVAYWRSVVCRSVAAARTGPVHVNVALREAPEPGLWPEPLDGRAGGAPWTDVSRPLRHRST